MFSKILIANRGEIACRIIRTAHRLGIQCVAVYSDIDQDSLHVRLADEAFRLGSAPLHDSYLCIDTILDVALQSGAQAIHPGYGLLSENAQFAEACEKAGICFIGPSAAAIQLMGFKAHAKRIMQEAGIPVIPGYDGDNIEQAARGIGYPLLLKPAAGGGGKGIHIVRTPEALNEQLERAKREAHASFGDSHIIFEKYIAQPRHIEIQIFGDKHGNVVQLFERDCSIQRRHQKIIEEAPAMGLSPTLRAELGRISIQAAKNIGYVGAGTIEFLVDAQENFYFMEMNTRLQVEHPVTEQVTGQDLVEWQLRIAAGEILPCTQAELAVQGHAIEVRICAENPHDHFLPSTGQLVHLKLPEEHLPYVRVETGVRHGDHISIYYDSMIAKLIVWDLDRERALVRLKQVLSECQIVGIETNVEFLTAVITSEAFKAGKLDTDFLERTIFPKVSSAPSEVIAITVLYLLLVQAMKTHQEAVEHQETASPWFFSDAWQMNLAATQTIQLLVQGQKKVITVEQHAHGYRIIIDNQAVTIHGELLENVNRLNAILDSKECKATVVPFKNWLYTFIDGQRYNFQLANIKNERDNAELISGQFRAPMPGTITALLVEKNALVEAGQGLIVVEAMKMEHTFYAPTPGYVRNFYYMVGERVDEGVLLLEFEANLSDERP